MYSPLLSAFIYLFCQVWVLSMNRVQTYDTREVLESVVINEPSRHMVHTHSFWRPSLFKILDWVGSFPSLGAELFSDCPGCLEQSRKMRILMIWRGIWKSKIKVGQSDTGWLLVAAKPVMGTSETDVIYVRVRRKADH